MNTKKNIVVTVVVVLSVFLVNAQNRNWKKEVSKDGKVTVKSEVAKDEEGKMIYYIAETTTNVTAEKVEEYLRKPSNYTYFLDYTENSKKIKEVSEDEWFTYMFVDAPWPMSNFDCVQKYKFQKTDKGFKLKGVADTDAYKKGDVKRMQVYTIEYAFEKINDTQNKLTITANYRPTASMPKFLLRGWFPNGPAKLMSKLLEGASKL
ncbi:hypothetical protein WH52_01435 [Tenacibaculum holothuriorum]|uniref:START domain-containing protein n=1 Tax=Tenacibaculum holothuriorum TaxID=1635173 RepID=A0A1Y2PHY3_9FLAO|nr:hypothetical protein [Tenacibaculum holothuriorum]OSY89329.1 hypothetical protein WH52_01435 [Tenacibaculum holothuriorum]